MQAARVLSIATPARNTMADSELAALRESEVALQKKLHEQRRRGSRAVLRAAVAEQEKRKLSETVDQLSEAMQPPHKQVRTLLLDPSVNAEIVRLREQVKHTERRELEVRQELEASQFSAQGIAGKKLMQKCKELQAENEQLGKELAEGKTQKLHATIALQKDYAKELRKSLAESREWVELLDEELEAAQSVIVQLRRDLHAARAAAPPADAAAAAGANGAEADAPAADAPADADMAEAPAADAAA